VTRVTIQDVARRAATALAGAPVVLSGTASAAGFPRRRA